MNYNKLIIITGSSKGIGKALVDILIRQNEVLILGASRSSVTKEASNYIHSCLDLSRLSDCQFLLNQISEIIKENQMLKSITLINNAATLGNIVTGVNMKSNTDLAETIFLNLTAPMILQNSIVKYCNNNINVEILNISSGAAIKPYYGWGAYCASKAGLILGTKVLALEIENLKLSAKIWCLAPGVVDTEMQEKIRTACSTNFIDLEKFKNFKVQGKLFMPNIVATFIIKALNNSNFKNGEYYDIREYLGN